MGSTDSSEIASGPSLPPGSEISFHTVLGSLARRERIGREYLATGCKYSESRATLCQWGITEPRVQAQDDDPLAKLER
jgi:hypothetical protein